MAAHRCQLLCSRYKMNLSAYIVTILGIFFIKIDLKHVSYVMWIWPHDCNTLRGPLLATLVKRIRGNQIMASEKYQMAHWWLIYILIYIIQDFDHLGTS